LLSRRQPGVPRVPYLFDQLAANQVADDLLANFQSGRSVQRTAVALRSARQQYQVARALVQGRNFRLVLGKSTIL
jgi:hypothetical protein